MTGSSRIVIFGLVGMCFCSYSMAQWKSSFDLPIASMSENFMVKAREIENWEMCVDCYHGFKSAVTNDYLNCTQCLVDLTGEECESCVDMHQGLLSCIDCGESLCQECHSNCDDCNNECFDCLPCLIFGKYSEKCVTKCNQCSKECATCVPCAPCYITKEMISWLQEKLLGWSEKWNWMIQAEYDPTSKKDKTKPTGNKREYNDTWIWRTFLFNFFVRNRFSVRFKFHDCF